VYTSYIDSLSEDYQKVIFISLRLCSGNVFRLLGALHSCKAVTHERNNDRPSRADLSTGCWTPRGSNTPQIKPEVDDRKNDEL
jgi:hypothetical protein